MKTLIFTLFSAIFLISCDIESQNTKVKNSDLIKIVNGMGKEDTVRYTCDSCEKYINSQKLFNKILQAASEDAKQSLNNPLSFIPRSIKLNIVPIDSLFYYDSNKLVDSCLAINIIYKCIGKNAYGTENEVNTENIIFVVGDSIRNNLLSEIRKAPLKLSENGVVNRDLALYDVDGEGNFHILPISKKPFSLIVTSTISCIDKYSRLYLTFEDNTEIILSNWNDFNCKGTAYFNLSTATIEKMKTLKIKSISFFADKQQYSRVPKNESDYFMQYANLLGN